MSAETVEFGDLKGLTLRSIRVNADKDRVWFDTADGRQFEMFHEQDCCEQVLVEEIIGDLRDLIGAPILVAEEVVSEKPPADKALEYEPESQTWTFYKLRTIKGSVDIRWWGTSNGYYSESVYFHELKD